MNLLVWVSFNLFALPLNKRIERISVFNNWGLIKKVLMGHDVAAWSGWFFFLDAIRDWWCTVVLKYFLHYFGV